MSAAAVTGGLGHTCAVLANGTAMCWGLNDAGHLGQGNTQSLCTPTPVDFSTSGSAVAIASGYDHTCVVLIGGAVKCWGANTFGRLGLGDTQHRGDAPGEMGDALPTVRLFSALW
jgi:alpha-tubulin suppressor-like RCC1 family protein